MKEAKTKASSDGQEYSEVLTLEDLDEMPGATGENDGFLAGGGMHSMEIASGGEPATKRRNIFGCIYDWWFVAQEPIISTVQEDNHGSQDPEEKRFDLTRFLQCAVGILVAYLSWGYLQEYIMTQSYESISTGEMETYPKGWSPFLVLQNRLVTLALATLLLWRETPTKFAPRIWYASVSFTNTVGSICQYEALKYVTFPVQTLLKSCKILMTQIVSFLVQRKVYPCVDYLIGIIIASGLCVYKFGNNVEGSDSASEAFTYGLILMLFYMLGDATTSNLQSKTYKDYGVSPNQMMWYVNFFSAIGTTLSMVTWLPDVLSWVIDHPTMWGHSFLLSACGTFGQWCIFYTIKRFGAVEFSIVMTLRQCMSILLSIFAYGHTVTALASVGLMLSGGGLAWKLQRRRAKSKR